MIIGETVLEIDSYGKFDLPEKFSNRVCFSPEFVKHFLDRYSKEGDNVLDIFAGFGTTLSVAEKNGRSPYGIEFEEERKEYIEDILQDTQNVFCGTAADLGEFDIPDIDLCITSPPFMTEQMSENPLSNYSCKSTYPEYLDSIERIFALLSEKMRDEGVLVVNVSNIIVEDKVTTLAWDIEERISESFHFEGEVIVDYRQSKDNQRNRGDYGFDHSYALIFQKKDL